MPRNFPKVGVSSAKFCILDENFPTKTEFSDSPKFEEEQNCPLPPPCATMPLDSGLCDSNWNLL